MGWKDKAHSILLNSTMMPIYGLFGGLSEFWAAIFATSAIILAFHGKLDGNFALAITAIQGILVAHDAMDDYHTRNMPVQQTVINNDITVQK
jgi:hypothetical protein